MRENRKYAVKISADEKIMITPVNTDKLSDSIEFLLGAHGGWYSNVPVVGREDLRMVVLGVHGFTASLTHNALASGMAAGEIVGDVLILAYTDDHALSPLTMTEAKKVHTLIRAYKNVADAANAVGKENEDGKR